MERIHDSSQSRGIHAVPIYSYLGHRPLVFFRDKSSGSSRCARTTHQFCLHLFVTSRHPTLGANMASSPARTAPPVDPFEFFNDWSWPVLENDHVSVPRVFALSLSSITESIPFIQDPE